MQRQKIEAIAKIGSTLVLAILDSVDGILNSLAQLTILFSECFTTQTFNFKEEECFLGGSLKLVETSWLGSKKSFHLRYDSGRSTNATKNADGLSVLFRNCLGARFLLALLFQ